jgi:CxxC motif-containing protein
VVNGKHADNVITDIKYVKNGKAAAVFELKTPKSLSNTLITDLMDDLDQLSVGSIKGTQSIVHTNDPNNNMDHGSRMKTVRVLEQVSPVYSSLSRPPTCPRS